MINNKRTIFANDNMIIAPYGYYYRTYDIKMYVGITSVYELPNFICFTINNCTNLCDTTTYKYYSTCRKIIDLCMYQNRVYEIYKDLFGSVRINTYDTKSRAYTSIDKIFSKRFIGSLIQELTGEPVIVDNIIWPKKIYDRSWPNYIISRINYCDIIFETVE